MKQRPPLPPGPYLVIGLARSGVAAALALRAADPTMPVTAVDSSTSTELEQSARRLGSAGVEVLLNTDGVAALTSTEPPQTVVKSPGVPAQAPVVAAARKHGLELLGELELGWRLVPNPFCAVTGTNGKTTTVEMIAAIHRTAGLPVAPAGNVGVPVSSLAGEVDPRATVICETSSFQLEDTVEFSPEVGVFLNFSEDHLDRHPDPGQYLAAKLRLFDNQGLGDTAVLNADDPAIATAVIGGTGARVWFGSADGCDLRVADGTLSWRGERLMDAGELALRGPHNLENAMAAAAATLVRGIEPAAVADALAGFEGIEHRLEQVGEHAGVSYVNDSKATNVSAADAALRSFESPVHAILGGSSKGSGFEGLRDAVATNCSACYLIGEAAARLRADLAPTGIDLLDCGDLERAVRSAAGRATAGEVVLLSPACASFDQYEDFEQRGRHFRELVTSLGDGR